ncbi:MAG: hypothetical protein Q9174_003796 [Haloplaca sp. 1 TL-2023]
MAAETSTDMEQIESEVDYPKKAIKCVLSQSKTSNSDDQPHLVFTHGAGGTLQSEGIANFAEGFASSALSILCFQGNMNLQSRVKMFKAVIDHQGKDTITAVGGRSMGARAAIMASESFVTHLVLISYPLHTDTQVRDAILKNIPDSVKVLFIVGDHDKMCDITRLDEVRSQMKCQTWRVIVEGADHGMAVKPKTATRPIGIKTGHVAADWLRSNPSEELEHGCISWNDAAEEAQWTGWQ